MMKTTRLAFGLLIGTICLMLFSFQSTPQSFGLSAHDTSKEKIQGQKQNQAKSNTNEQRRAWYESMHRAAPGTDWRVMDRSYLQSKRQNSSRYDQGIVNGRLKGQWRQRGANNQAGSVVYASYDQANNLLKCVSAGGILWSTDLDSIVWKPMNDQMRMQDVLFYGEFLRNGSLVSVYGSGNGEVFYSMDSLKSWTAATGLTDLKNSGSIQKMIQCGDSSFFLLSQEIDTDVPAERYNLHYSNDGAKTFNKIKSMPPNQYGAIVNIDLHSIDPKDSKAYLYFRDSISEYNANDGSISFSHPAFPFIWGRVQLTGGRMNDSLRLYAHVDEQFYVSNGDGSKWQAQGTLKLIPFTSNSISYSNTDSQVVVIADTELYHSSDGANTWTKFNESNSYYDHPEDSLHADIPYLGRFEKSSGEEFHLVGTNGGLYISWDQLQSVKNISLLDHPSTQYYSTYTEELHDSILFAGSQDQGFQRAMDNALREGLLDFDQSEIGSFGHLTSSDSGKTIWAVSPDRVGVFTNPNVDSTFSFSFQFSDSIETLHWLPPIVADPSNPLKAYLVGAHDKGDPDKKSVIYEMEVVGGNIQWSSRSFNFNLEPNKSEYLSALSISNFDSLNWYAITNKGNFYYSFDGGNAWTRSSFFNGPGPQHLYGSSIYASKTHPNQVYVGGSGYSNKPVFFSWNNGRDWREFSTGLPSTLVYDLTGNHNDSLLFAATEVGPFVYSQKEGEWFAMSNDTAPDQIYWSVEFLNQKNTARFGTHGRGIWDFEVSQVDTTVGIFMPLSIMIFDVPFPNPASSRITWNISIKQPQYATVYDLQGKRIMDRVLYEGSLDVSDLKEGSYLLQIETPDATQTTRFLKMEY